MDASDDLDVAEDVATTGSKAAGFGLVHDERGDHDADDRGSVLRNAAAKTRTPCEGTALI